MDLSVIIVSYNVRYFLSLCLCSVQNAAHGLNCEIFVVDNNSSDDSCEMVKKEFPKVKLIANDDNKGFSAANNQAIKAASGRYILLLNPDTIIGEDTFMKCIEFMDKHPDAGAAGVMMINGKGKYLPESKRAIPYPKTAFYKISGLSYLFPRSSRFNRYYMGNLDPCSINNIDVISGAFMFIRSEAVAKTGLLDESFFMYGEDIDYSYRLLKAGYKNYYFPETKILHFKGESTNREDIDFVINFYNAMLIFVKKHFNNRNLRRIMLTVRIAILFRAALSVAYRLLRKILSPFPKLINVLHLKGSHDVPKTGIMIISDAKGHQRIKELLAPYNIEKDIHIGINEDQDNENDSIRKIITDIEKGIRNNRIRQIIFSLGQMKYSTVINCMQLLSHHRLRFKIASPGERYLVGSGSVIVVALK